MTDKGGKVRNFIYRLERNPKEARALYAEKFGVEPDSPEVGKEIDALLRELDDTAIDASIAVPARLLVAVAIRPRGKGLGRSKPPKAKWAKRHEAMAIRFASSRWRELDAVARSLRAKKAAKKTAVAETMVKIRKGGEFEYAGIGPTTLANKMRLRRN